jgi:hypothetical protein
MGNGRIEWRISATLRFPSLTRYDHLNAVMNAGDLVRLDVGCESAHYSGDLGRTVTPHVLAERPDHLPDQHPHRLLRPQGGVPAASLPKLPRYRPMPAPVPGVTLRRNREGRL